MTTTSLRENYPVATWVVMTTWLLSLAGLGCSIYLTMLHFNASLEFCPNTGVINCGLVTTGPYSTALSIPFAFLGLAYFVAMAVLCSPWVWAQPQLWVHQVRLVASVTGVAMICYLIYIEAAIKHHLCLWCTGVHIVTFAIFVVLITNQVTADDALSENEVAES